MNSSRTSVNRLGIGAMKSKSEGKIEDNYYIEGVVTMSPSAGNITDRNIIIQDETGGIVVRFDNNIGSGVKEGNKLKILVKDARMGSFANVTQVSDINYSGKIDGENIVTLIEENAPLPTPIKLTLDELKRGNYESVLVEVEGVQFVTDDVNQILAGTRTITDCNDKFLVYTRTFATFANTKTPDGSGKITAIASSYYDEKQLLLRNTNVFSEMSGTRCSELNRYFMRILKVFPIQVMMSIYLFQIGIILVSQMVARNGRQETTQTINMLKFQHITQMNHL